MAKGKCDDFCTYLFGECWFLVLFITVGPCLVFIVVFGFFFWLLSAWFNHDVSSAGEIHDPFFWTVLIIFIIPAFTVSIVSFLYGLSLIMQRPNTLGCNLDWKDAAYFAAMLSTSLFIAGLKALKHDWAANPPLPITWLQNGATVVWLPYSIYVCCKLMVVPSWYGIKGEVLGPELEQIRTKVAERIQAYTDNYNFYLTVEKAYVISSPLLEEKFDAFCEHHRSKGKPCHRMELFHGTSRSSAKSIIESGFRLPTQAGMFGKGVYFADTPLKSMQYTRAWRGTILVCEVELGNTMMKSLASSELAPEIDMQRSWFMRTVLKAQDFDSVTARSWPFGSVRVPEYVIYKPEQAVPRYLILCRQHRKK